MEQIQTVLYTAKVHTTGGRNGGTSVSSDGRLNIQHSVPGGPGAGTNPEQLLAAGWSACFEGAIGIAAKKMRVKLPEGLAIDAEIDLCLTGDAYSLQARLNVSLPGLDHVTARALTDAAEQTCPYSKALKNNVEVQVNIL